LVALHQFRHSALTHLAEDDVQLPLLMAKSRHRSLRTLQRYARPGPDAVAALTARTTRGAAADARRSPADRPGARVVVTSRKGHPRHGAENRRRPVAGVRAAG
jgi:hypothetical protein